MNVELFACSGGMAEGFRRAGINFDLAIDHDLNCCRAYRHNLNSDRVICADVHDLVDAAREDWSPGTVDLLVADPPCTPWSRAGKRRGLADERDMIAATMSLIEYWRPRRWLIANVPGLDDSDHWVKVVQPIIGQRASELGYCVDFARFNAADYGVPQFRVRPFWFGHRIDTACIRWPAPTHGKPNGTPTLPGMSALLPWVTCREALSHLRIDEIGRPVVHTKNRKHPHSKVDEPSYCITTGASRHQTNCLERPDWWYRKSPADEPTRAISTRANNKLEWPWGHMSQGIALSEKAAAILQGFPESWRFVGHTKKARWSQIGQAMPPPLSAAVAGSIVEAL